MDKNIYKEFGTRIAKYDSQYTDLFTSFARKGSLGGDTIILGYSFETNYEFYLYCFFLGFYSNQRVKSLGAKADFSHEIENWGAKKNSFDLLKKYMFITCFNHTENVSFIDLEKGDITSADVVNELMLTMEEYTNAGLLLVKEILESEPNYFKSRTGFMDLILN